MVLFMILPIWLIYIKMYFWQYYQNIDLKSMNHWHNHKNLEKADSFVTLPIWVIYIKITKINIYFGRLSEILPQIIEITCKLISMSNKGCKWIKRSKPALHQVKGLLHRCSKYLRQRLTPRPKAPNDTFSINFCPIVVF